MASVLKQGQVVATACRLVHTLLIIHFQFALYPLSFQSCPVSLSFSQAGLLTHLAGISKNEHHTYRLLYKNVLGLQAGPFFFCLDTDLTLEFKERFSTSTSHPWHSQPDSLLSVSGIPSPGYPRKPSAWPSLFPRDTVADMVLHMLRSTQEEFYKNSTQEEFRKILCWPLKVISAV